MARSNSARALEWQGARQFAVLPIEVQRFRFRINKMPPARVEQHVERRIIFVGLTRDNEIGGGVKPIEVDAEMRKLAVEADRQHAMRAIANRLSVQK